MYLSIHASILNILSFLLRMKNLDLLALAMVNLELGNPGEAEALLFSMSKVRLST